MEVRLMKKNIPTIIGEKLDLDQNFVDGSRKM